MVLPSHAVGMSPTLKSHRKSLGNFKGRRRLPMQEADENRRLLWSFKFFSRSDYAHVFSTWTFLSLPFREGHSLAFSEIVEARTFQA